MAACSVSTERSTFSSGQKPKTACASMRGMSLRSRNEQLAIRFDKVNLVPLTGRCGFQPPERAVTAENGERLEETGTDRAAGDGGADAMDDLGSVDPLPL